MTDIVGIAYCSQPVDFSFDKVDEILATAHRNNSKAELTGSLIYDNNYFLQWLEGGPEEIRTVFERISLDPRHSDVKLLTVRKLSDRWFPNWTMTAAVTEDQTLRGLKLVPHLSLSKFNPIEWSENDVTSFMDALSDHLTRRPTPRSEPMPDQTSLRPARIEPVNRLDQHLSKIT